MPKKSLAALFVFFLLALGIDTALGASFDRLLRRVRAGERGGLTNLALSKEAELLVLGSSRAQFQVVPKVLSEYVSGRIYNAGLKGHDFLYAAMLLDLWEHRHPGPRAVILVLDMESLLRRPSELSAAQLMAPYIDESRRVRDVLYQDGPFKRLAYLSRAFRYNGKALPILKNLSRAPEPSDNGYLEAVGVFDPSRPPQRHGLLDMPDGEPPSDAVARRLATGPFWDFKLSLLKDMGESAQRRGYRLFLVHTPIYGLDRIAHDAWLGRLRQLTAAHPAVEVIDLCEYARPREVGGRPELFMNFNHLNYEGARLLSAMLGESVARSLSRQARGAPAGRAIEP